MIAYDASRDALYRPALRAPLFAQGLARSGDALCAELSRLAYLAFENDAAQRQRLGAALASVGYARWSGFSDAATGTQAFAAIDATHAGVFVVFRGTVPGDLRDLATNINVRPVAWAAGGMAHAGFSAAFESVRLPIEGWLAANGAGIGSPAASVTVTGHSLGAALATLAMSRWRARRLVTFGCPRVGDAAFVATLDAIASTRYVGCCDLVCAVPPASPWYANAGLMRYIDRSGAVVDAPADGVLSADRDSARSEYLTSYALRAGNVLLRELADHAAINYVRALI